MLQLNVTSKQFQVAPYVSVGIQSHKLYVGFGSIQFVIENSETIPNYLAVLEHFKIPNTLKSAITRFGQSFEIKEILEKLTDRRMLLEVGTYDPADRWSRQNLFLELSGIPSMGQTDKLSKARIAIVGCGGIGNQVAVHLATAGVRSFVLCDADTIEASNLSRQILFAESDIGKLKTHILRRELERRLQGLEAICVEAEIRRPEDLGFCEGVDLVVVSADKGNVVSHVNAYCAKRRIPYINVGYINDIAVWGPFFIPGESGCNSCQEIVAGEGASSEIRDLIRKINHGYQAPSVGPVNMISSGLATLDILRFLVGAKEKIRTLNKRVGLWTHKMEFEEQDCSRNPNCQVCGG